MGKQLNNENKVYVILYEGYDISVSEVQGVFDNKENAHLEALRLCGTYTEGDRADVRYYSVHAWKVQ